MRGNGGGSFLAVEMLASIWGCSKAALHVHMTNTPAVGLYRCAMGSKQG